MPINGTHASQGYDYTNTTSSATQFGGQANNSAAPSSNATSTTAPATTTDNNGNIPKDEVGWYFVEQYYTTLSRNPHKLFVSTTVSLDRVFTLFAVWIARSTTMNFQILMRMRS